MYVTFQDDGMDLQKFSLLERKNIHKPVNAMV